MRITGGEFRGRKILTPDSEIKGFRPTMDFIREVIFSSLGSYLDFQGSKILDLFSGSGAFTFEAISRGAKYSCLIEQNKTCCRFIKENSENFNVSDLIEVHQSSVFDQILCDIKFDIIFADPPYDSIDFKKLINHLKANKLFSNSTYLVYEDSKDVIKNLTSDELLFKTLGLDVVKQKTHSESGILILHLTKL